MLSLYLYFLVYQSYDHSRSSEGDLIKLSRVVLPAWIFQPSSFSKQSGNGLFPIPDVLRLHLLLTWGILP